MFYNCNCAFYVPIASADKFSKIINILILSCEDDMMFSQSRFFFSEPEGFAYRFLRYSEHINILSKNSCFKITKLQHKAGVFGKYKFFISLAPADRGMEVTEEEFQKMMQEELRSVG